MPEAEYVALQTLTPEMRDEAEAVIKETVSRAHNYAERGRSSMPIDLTEVLVLAALAAQALGVGRG